MGKRFWVSLLVCVNLALLTGIMLVSSSPPMALAQDAGLGGNYLIVTAEIMSSFDGIFVLDVKRRVLHSFFYDRGPDKLVYAGYRDLETDFRNKE
ncbi:MAG: hypothetical protein JXO22_07575 [Phycisphaerae bacterium]|nr:hypothetical protein [Phycisphaerae bacterium]